MLAGVACPAGVTICDDCIVMQGTVGTLSPSDSDYVGPDGTLSSSDPAGILFPAVPAGMPFPVGLLALWALIRHCPHPTLPEYCFRPFLQGYHSQ